MAFKFTFREEPSSMFGSVHRPYAPVLFWSEKRKRWLRVFMLVDTGADYTILPKRYANRLGINLSEDTARRSTSGVGGSTAIYILRNTIRAKINTWERKVPLGILDSNSIPPLLGRQGFLETFKVTFHKHVTIFEDK